MAAGTLDKDRTDDAVLDVTANRLLAALRPAERRLIEPHMKPAALDHDDVLFEPGDDVHTTYFPCHRTMISLRLVTRDGEQVEVATIGREGAVGGVVSNGNKPAFGQAVVQIAGAAFKIPTEKLDKVKNGSPRVADLFARYSDALLAQMMQSAACNALHPIEQRCCRWLLSAHDRAGDHSFHLTQQALAEMLGVQRTTVTAVSSKLQAKRLIAYRRGAVEILDRAGLEKAACECYAAVESHFTRLLPDVSMDDER